MFRDDDHVSTITQKKKLNNFPEKLAWTISCYPQCLEAAPISIQRIRDRVVIKEGILIYVHTQLVLVLLLFVPEYNQGREIDKPKKYFAGRQSKLTWGQG